MRKFLLATTAVVGASMGMAGIAAAQTPAPAPVPVQSLQGNVATPANGNFASVYGDNNYMNGFVTKGPVAIPTPGTMVIRLGVRFDIEASGSWSNLDSYSGPGPKGSGSTVAGGGKLSPTQFEEYVRIYTGVDAMAANGLRYGAALEIRQNYGAAPQAETGSIGGSAYTSTQTLFVRRAFAYVAGDQWGIVRLGEMDGLIGTYDEGGATTGVFLSPTGTTQGGDLQGTSPTNAWMPGYYAAQSGNEYGNSKLVYLSPSFAGFDVGFQYAPNGFNGFTDGEGCYSAASGACANLASSTAAASGSLVQNQYAVGVRYQADWGPANILAYGIYMGSGHTNYTGGATAAQVALGTNFPTGGRYNGQFDDLSLGMFGANVTVAGLALYGNVMYGAVNGILGTKPQGAPDAVGVTGGTKYTFGPYTIGAVYSQFDSQGAYQLTGISQRHEWEMDAAATYTAAPGLVFWLEYIYGQRHQGDYNFATNNIGSAYNNVQAQAVMFGTMVTW